MFLQLLTVFSVAASSSTSLAYFAPISTEFMGNKAHLYKLEEPIEVKPKEVSLQFNSFPLTLKQLALNYSLVASESFQQN
jgi:hypothetical protein